MADMMRTIATVAAVLCSCFGCDEAAAPAPVTEPPAAEAVAAPEPAVVPEATVPDTTTEADPVDPTDDTDDVEDPVVRGRPRGESAGRPNDFNQGQIDLDRVFDEP